jgi:hypothetical protein
MTRKDYESIALVLRSERERSLAGPPPGEYASDVIAEQQGIDVLDRVAHALAVEFKADNPRFDRDRFLIACGAARR